jgi:hypothetical protein
MLEFLDKQTFSHVIQGMLYHISLSGRRVVDFRSIVSQKRPLTLKYIHNNSALEYLCSLYHKELQYIGKLRQITIDLYITTRHNRNSKNTPRHSIE